MKILFLCHFFPPTHTSGAENYTFNLAKALVNLGHQAYVLCAGTWDHGESYWNGYTEELYEGIHVRRVHLCWHKAPDPNRYLYDNPIIAAHLEEWLQEIQPNVAHITSCYTLSSSVIKVCHEVSLPMVLTLVDFWFLCPSLHLLRGDGSLCDGHTTPWDCLKCMLHDEKVYRWSARILPDNLAQTALTGLSGSSINRLRGLRGKALNMAERKQILFERLHQIDVIIAPSHFIASVHTSHSDRLPVQVQSHGHDLSWLAEYQKTPRDGHIRFCYVGQISHDKGVHVLIEAFLKLNLTSAIVLDIWGSLNDTDSYTTYIKQLAVEVERIRLRGKFPREQLAKVLAEADVIIVPSIWYENNPLVIHEAFAAQIPVIATNLGGMSEFVQHEANGLLFQRGNADDLSQQMRRIIEDVDILPRLQAGISAVKTIEQEVTDLVCAYEKILRNKER